MILSKNANKLITFILVGIFALSFVLPTLQGPLGVKFDGISVAILNIGGIKFVQNIGEYITYLFIALTNLWVILLFVWSFRSKINFVPTLILSILAISSSLSWIVNMKENNVLLSGYWVWVISILLISVFNLAKASNKIKLL